MTSKSTIRESSIGDATPSKALMKLARKAVYECGITPKELISDDDGASQPTVSRVLTGKGDGISFDGGVAIGRQFPLECQVELAAACFPLIEHGMPIARAQPAADVRPIGVRVIDACIGIGNGYQSSIERAAVVVSDGHVSAMEKADLLASFARIKEAVGRAEAIVADAPETRPAHGPRYTGAVG